MEAAMAEQFVVLAGGASDYSNMSKICRKLIWLHVGAWCPLRELGCGSEGHGATPSIWHGSSLKWSELEVPGRKNMRETSARRIYRRRGGTKLDPYIRRSQGAFGPMVVRSNE
jgi:hypothetical protein